MVLNKVMDAAAAAGGSVANAAGNIASKIKGKCDDAECLANCKEAEKKYREYYKNITGSERDIEIEVDELSDVPSDAKEFMKSGAPRSFSCWWTLQFLRDEDKRKIWEKGCDKVILTYQDSPSEEDLERVDEYADAIVGRKDETVYIKFFRRAMQWHTLYLRDEIEYGLDMYLLTGKCWYKSGWVKDFPEPKMIGTDKVERWFQLRHWCIYWYPRQMWGWNWKASEPPEGEDTSKLDKLPGLPDIKLPSLPNVKWPDMSMPDMSMPDVSMPDVSMPDVSMPDISAPDLSAPDLSAPDLSAPDLPKQKERPKNKWAPHGRIQMDGAKVCAKGKKLIISNATVLQFWDNVKNGYEEQKRARIEVECPDSEQAESWVLSCEFGGAEVGEASSGCCSVM